MIAGDTPSLSRHDSPRAEEEQGKAYPRETTVLTTTASPSDTPTEGNRAVDETQSEKKPSILKEVVWDLAGTVHIPNLTQGLGNAICAPVIPLLLRNSLGATDAMIGYIVSINGVGRVAADIPTAIAVGMFNIRIVLVASMVIFSLATALTFIAPNFFVVAVGSFLYGSAFATYFTSRHFFLVDAMEKSKRGRMMSWIGGGQRWALVFGPLIGGYLTQLYGPRVALLACFPCALNTAYWTWTSKKIKDNDTRLANLKRMKELEDEAKGLKKEDETMMGAVSHHFRELTSATWNNRQTFISVGGFAVGILSLRTCRRMYLPLAAMNLNLPPSQVGLMLTISFFVDASLFFLGGMLMDRFGRRAAAIPTALLYAASFYFLSVANSSTQLALCALCFGFSDITGSGMLLTMVADASQGAKSLMAALRLTMDLGGFFGPALGGAVMHAFDFRNACLAMSFLGLTAALWCYSLIAETHTSRTTKKATMEEEKQVSEKMGAEDLVRKYSSVEILPST